jgi:hypothetical protein
MKTYRVVEVYIHVFLTSALVGGDWSSSRPGPFTPGERAPGTHWIGGWVGPRAGLDDVKKRKILSLSLRFGGTMRLRLHGRRISRVTPPASCWSLAWLSLRPWMWWHVTPRRRLTFNGLHGVISQKIELFITTGVRTSSPTNYMMLVNNEVERNWKEGVLSPFEVLFGDLHGGSEENTENLNEGSRYPAWDSRSFFRMQIRALLHSCGRDEHYYLLT